jgi:ankyrin repeat protein
MLDAIQDGRTDLVFDYLVEGHAATSADANGVPLIRWCAYYGDVSAVRHLLANGEELASLGRNLDLNGAAFHGHWRLCQFLLERGADANGALEDTGETPLHSATCTDRPAHERVVEVLLAAGADPDRATRPGVETGAFMRDARTRGETPLHRAAAFATEGTIRALVAAGARLDARDAHGDSPLSWASWHGRPAHVLDLLCFGEHRVHPAAVERSRANAGPARTGAMELALLGRPHAGL